MIFSILNIAARDLWKKNTNFVCVDLQHFVLVPLLLIYFMEGFTVIFSRLWVFKGNTPSMTIVTHYCSSLTNEDMETGDD